MQPTAANMLDGTWMLMPHGPPCAGGTPPCGRTEAPNHHHPTSGAAFCSGGAAVQAALLASDDFCMWKMKVLTCEDPNPHEWGSCPFAHPPHEMTTRRDPRLYNYEPVYCSNHKHGAGSCLEGSACEYAHNVFEVYLHPKRYRTQMCSLGSACHRTFCFFAHRRSELRVCPSPSPSSSKGNGGGSAMQLSPAASPSPPSPRSGGGSSATSPVRSCASSPDSMTLQESLLQRTPSSASSFSLFNAHPWQQQEQEHTATAAEAVSAHATHTSVQQQQQREYIATAAEDASVHATHTSMQQQWQQQQQQQQQQQHPFLLKTNKHTGLFLSPPTYPPPTGAYGAADARSAYGAAAAAATAGAGAVAANWRDAHWAASLQALMGPTSSAEDVGRSFVQYTIGQAAAAAPPLSLSGSMRFDAAASQAAAAAAAVPQGSAGGGCGGVSPSRPAATGLPLQLLLMGQTPPPLHGAGGSDRPANNGHTPSPPTAPPARWGMRLSPPHASGRQRATAEAAAAASLYAFV